MGGGLLRIASGAVVAALLCSSTAGAAAANSGPSTATQAPAVQNGWTTLSMLTPAGSIGLAGAAVQPGPESSGPPPPAPPPVYGAVPATPVPVIAIWLATVATAIYILTRNHHNRFFFPPPNSPA